MKSRLVKDNAAMVSTDVRDKQREKERARSDSGAWIRCSRPWWSFRMKLDTAQKDGTVNSYLDQIISRSLN